jgi:hypothetical protein
MRYIAPALFLSISTAVAAPICDGVADDTAAVLAAAISGERLPAGTCRVTSDIALTASGGYQSGMRLRGAGMLRSTILADYNGSITSGAVIRLDTSGAGNYTVGTEISDLAIKQAPGRTGLNGIQLTAAWMVKIDRVQVAGMSGSGIVAPLRSDINPISDFYQDLSVVISQSWIAQNAGWGINFGAGQSPGLFKLEYSIIANNTGGGIRSTTGQCEILSNVIVGNGAYGTNSGGLLFTTAEGPSMVAKVERNEFDTNYNWHVNLLRSRGLELRQNRFLSQTYSANQGGVLQSGAANMRPMVHVTIGGGAANEVWDMLAVRNLHRSVTGPSVTTPTVIGYTVSGGAASASHPLRFERNDFGPSPADGVIQNSTGLVKYIGTTGIGAEIVDP